MTPSLAERLLDSLGINLHVLTGDSPYIKRFPEVCQKLVDLGVRHARDGGGVKWPGKNPTYNDAGWERLKQLPCDVLYVLDAVSVYDSTLEGKKDAAGKPIYPYRLDYSRTDIALLRSKLGAKVIGWEGVNEPDLKAKDPATGLVYSDWPAKAAAFQQAANKDTALDETRPLLSPALGNPWKSERYAALGFGLWDRGDLAAWHPYADKKATAPPDTPYFAANLRLLRRYSLDQPIWATEAGYQTGAVENAVSEEQQATYLIQTAFHHLSVGIPRTYFYELIDASPAGGWGLLRYDLSEKPAFTQLKALIGNLSPVPVSQS